MLTGSDRVSLPFSQSSYQAMCIKDLENTGVSKEITNPSVLSFWFNISPTMDAPLRHFLNHSLAICLVSHINSSLLSIPTLNPQT